MGTFERVVEIAGACPLLVVQGIVVVLEIVEVVEGRWVVAVACTCSLLDRWFVGLEGAECIEGWLLIGCHLLIGLPMGVVVVHRLLEHHKQVKFGLAVEADFHSMER